MVELGGNSMSCMPARYSPMQLLTQKDYKRGITETTHTRHLHRRNRIRFEQNEE